MDDNNTRAAAPLKPPPTLPWRRPKAHRLGSKSRPATSLKSPPSLVAGLVKYTMRHHTLQPLPRTLIGYREPAPPRRLFNGDAWSRLDRVQELGVDGDGHTGCVNALSWSEDGSILLSGSDDKRICIWTADSRSDSPYSSPHPLRLRDTIVTGHSDNIFSAKFLPNANTPTIVSCAGDRDVQVFDVERLTSTEGTSIRSRGSLWGVDGPGVRVLRCHRDRTKRIATEQSPFMFLTVSEDGTVRQHDLRRPHVCREECPDPLFRAPHGVDLYSLSVSGTAPHTFAVAGQTSCAFICDRRMPEHQIPSWGPHTRRAAQVHCVRRLGIPKEEWESINRKRRYGSERHITCVKMSPHRSDEVICAFTRHSTALFSINDSIVETRAADSSRPGVLPSNRPGRARQDSDNIPEESATGCSPSKNTQPTSFGAPGTPPPMKRVRTNEYSSNQPTPRGGSEELEGAPNVAATVTEAQDTPSNSGDQGIKLGPDDIVDPDVRGIQSDMDLDEGTEGGDASGREEGSDDGDEEDDALAAQRRQELERRFLWDEEGSDEELDLLQYGINTGVHEAGVGPIEEFGDSDDEYEDDDDRDSNQDAGGMSWLRRRNLEVFQDVDLVHPRRYFRGARNIDTVKDCNFLGDMSDKVCSGSDDGNFFVWDKLTGRLEGIWGADGDVVNVMEQHPTLPLIAVSGIDWTVKMFAPTVAPPTPSFNLTRRAESIVSHNRAISRREQPGEFVGGSGTILEMLAAFMARTGSLPTRRDLDCDDSDEDDDDEDEDDDDDTGGDAQGGPSVRIRLPASRSRALDDTDDDDPEARVQCPTQ